MQDPPHLVMFAVLSGGAWEQALRLTLKMHGLRIRSSCDL